MIQVTHIKTPAKDAATANKSWLWTVLLFTLLFALCKCSQKDNTKVSKSLPETTINVDSMLKDFGEIAQYSTAEATFSIKNTGTHNLVLSEVDTDCHCTIASWDSLPIPPGQTAKIKVNFDTKSLGFFQQTVNATLNTKEKAVSFLIRGKVLQAEEK